MYQDEKWLLKEKYHGVESEAFHADCARLATGEPLGYLIGHVPFLNCTIHLDSHPLIPRPETEFWTEQAIAEIIHQATTKTEVRGRTTYLAEKSAEHKQNPGLPRYARKDATEKLRDGIPKRRDSIPTILDLCAGSGAIGVAVAKALPEAQVTFAEVDSTHLPTIKKNIAFNSTVNSTIKGDGNYKNIESDVFKNITAESKFDFILTNPPYIDVLANTIDANVALHEPHLALFGGVSGMEIIARIIAEAPNYLTLDGQLWIEHEPIQSVAILELANAAGFATAVTHVDQYGVLRFSVLTMAQ